MSGLDSSIFSPATDSGVTLSVSSDLKDSVVDAGGDSGLQVGLSFQNNLDSP